MNANYGAFLSGNKGRSYSPPETEILVEAVVEQLQAKTRPRILEIGVGSGAIAVSLAVFLPTATVVGVDVSAGALKVAAQNACRHRVIERLTLLQGDLYALW